MSAFKVAERYCTPLRKRTGVSKRNLLLTKGCPLHPSKGFASGLDGLALQT